MDLIAQERRKRRRGEGGQRLAGGAAGGRLGVIIGQAPNASAAAGFRPLEGLAEQRLARLAGLTVEALWERFDRRNVLSAFPGRKHKDDKHGTAAGYALHASTGDRFPMEEARAAAAAMDLSGYRLVVLLGLRVASAFRLRQPKLLEESCSAKSPLACPVLVLPHTSGVSHFWNEPQNVRLAEDAFRRAMARHMS